jgi:hypothetical protein
LDSNPDLRERITRWDDIRRDEFTSALTTFAALATGGLGFSDESFAHKHSGDYSVWLAVALVVFWVGLIAAGGCTVTRLLDARSIAQKQRSELRGASDSDLDLQLEWTRRLGRWSWWLLWVLIGAVGVGACCLTIYFELAY